MFEPPQDPRLHTEQMIRFRESMAASLAHRAGLVDKTPESAGFAARIDGFARLENRAAAAQLVEIGALFAYRLARSADTQDWCADTMDAVAAEVGAALRISRASAAGRIRDARAMRERVPQVAAVFCAGEIGWAAFRTIAFRTDLIEDRAVLARVDAVIAANVTRWPSLTGKRLADKIDQIVVKADADAVRRRQEKLTDREIEIDDDTDGFSHIRGTLVTSDARALDSSLSALAATVCPHDPRTPAQRRADAIGALSARATRMACQCGHTDCAAGNKPAASPVVIHVIAEAASLDGTGEVAGSELGVDALISPEVLTELAKSAKRVPLVHPGYAPPEPQYRPSKALADFVRCRDLTCRWPGCDVPAIRCEIDHTIPWSQGGPTHAANLKCLCRQHHLVKTFWGWTEKQLPDATLILTCPDGDTYLSTPGSALLFPSLCTAVGGMPATDTDPPQDYCGERSAMMPTRRRTRAQDRAQRVAAERRHNREARTGAAVPAGIDGRPPPDDEPPPF